MKIHADSHLDHNLTPAHVAFLRSHFAGKTGFFIETVILPHELSDLTCGLYGPTMGQPIDPRDPPPTATVPLGQHGRWLIQPGTVYLGVTKEYTETEKLVPMLHGRSSIGRYGLFIHVTAGVGDPGFRGNFTLELVATQPVYVYPDMKIGQLTYHQVSGEDQPYAGRYQGDKTPVASRYHLPEKR
jgi:deoxycytidine triphosphate deaminase